MPTADPNLSISASKLSAKDLKEYRKIFREMIRENDQGIINNNSRDHAKVILQELIRSAEKEILIQCSHLSSDIYGDPETQEQLKLALGRGVHLTIAIRDDKPEAETFFKELQDLYQENVRINRAADVFPLDFCVVDGKRFRLEKDQEQGSAYVCACNQEISQLLQSNFIPRTAK